MKLYKKQYLFYNERTGETVVGWSDEQFFDCMVVQAERKGCTNWAQKERFVPVNYLDGEESK